MSQKEADLELFKSITGIEDNVKATQILEMYSYDVNQAVESTLNGHFSDHRNSPPRSNASLNQLVNRRENSNSPARPTTSTANFFNDTQPRISPTNSSINNNNNNNNNNINNNNNNNNNNNIFFNVIRRIPGSFTPQIEASPTEIRTRAAIKFIANFQASYGPLHPSFLPLSYKDAVIQASNNNKLLLVYLQSDLHQDTERFCRSVMCNEAFINFVNSSVLLWGGSVNSADAFALSGLMNTSTVTVIDRIEGFHTCDSLVGQLQSSVTANETAQIAEAVRLETINADRQLRVDQEREYEDTVAADRERIRLEEEQKAIKAKMEQEKKDKEELEAAIALSSQLSAELDIDRKRKAIKEEPKAGPGVSQFRINLPNGTKLQRKFNEKSTLKDIRNYLDVYFGENNISIKNYDLATNYPKRSFSLKESDLTLKDAGLAGNIILFLYDLDA